VVQAVQNKHLFDENVKVEQVLATFGPICQADNFLFVTLVEGFLDISVNRNVMACALDIMTISSTIISNKVKQQHR
jgi:hypothetical protein